MKKVLLASIIMFGVCGYVTAQSAKESKVKRNVMKPTTTSVAPTPQKAAIVSDEKVVEVEKTPASDITGKPAADKAVVRKTTASKTTTVNAAGEVIDADVVKKKEIEAAKTKKTKDN